MADDKPLIVDLARLFPNGVPNELRGLERLITDSKQDHA